MSLAFLTVRNGRKVLTTDGAADPHFQYTAGRPKLVAGRADADPLALIILNGRVVPIGAMYTPGASNSRERNLNNVPWEAQPLIIPPNALGTETDGSILIKGRAIRNLDVNGSPAIWNQSTRLVRIVDSYVMGYGGYGDGKNLICSDATGNRLEVVNTIGFSGNPGVAGTFAGRFVTSKYYNSLKVENCEMYGTTGINAIAYNGNHTASDSIKIRLNKIRNLDGRISSGSSNYRTGNTWGQGAGSDFVIANLLALDGAQGVSVELALNDCLNEAGKSRFEDMFSFNKARGNSNVDPIWVHHNLFRGGYVYDPFYIPGTSTTYGNNMPTGGATGLDQRGYQFSGGGGLLSDGIGTGYADDPAYGLAEDNVVLDISNYGLGISSGHDQAILRNLILRSGLVHNFSTDVIVAWNGTPIQVQDYQTNKDPARWLAHIIRDNICGHTYFNVLGGNAQSRDLFTIDPAFNPVASYSASGNIDLGFQTRAMVDQAEANWRSARAGEGRVIGAV